MARKSTTSSAAKSDGTVKLKAVVPTAKTAAKSEPAKAPRPTIVAAATPVEASEQIKKPEFLDRALARTDVKRRDAKPAIEAAMAELAAILLEGKDVNFPPLGKIKVVKSKDVGEGAQVLTLKMRSMKDGAGQPKIGITSGDDDA